MRNIAVVHTAIVYLSFFFVPVAFTAEAIAQQSREAKDMGWITSLSLLICISLEGVSANISCVMPSSLFGVHFVHVFQVLATPQFHTALECAKYTPDGVLAFFLPWCLRVLALKHPSGASVWTSRRDIIFAAV